MKENIIIQNTAEFIRNKFEGESTGHDWWHIYRVWKDATNIGKKEGADSFVIEMAALIHDLGDSKFNTAEEGRKKIDDWLMSQELPRDTIDKIHMVIEDISFKGAKVADHNRSIESVVVQDADRLDAIGAIGIARAFAYGGKVGRPLYDPNIKPEMHEDYESYRTRGNSSTINHFYEKLLLLQDRMTTKTAKRIAKERHEYMEQFLQRFYKEWKGQA